ncbi:sugar ABC transporter substrate-binding protein [Streptomyces ipomoeae]|uniref:Periplasmic binding protein and sugar binding domain of the LacI family protein n=2 Tax=Streptomyces ipomoeae TaxID=103232 RepID=L1KUU7_9ACTN|nr:substrate-binding domain-containing protein [Streptomyces ipomoeae]EKX64402.1 periplasmic binding protein and sugar binding domain of the LacI family protein [Streptomyces ipomoeae 91-03]MDX2693697.1 substrate-binding domain-containing protein [Streptomyces ipomoeae]MDX2822768.1 substrate-binding domain-containing protein [Streptomyces ipomoeae]MDX2839418.1 substrate-binding domain-containing protein [Streptomyces ipomoeae]MDX2875441.1 substrate-binding domain-containing protein [Streptomyc
MKACIRDAVIAMTIVSTAVALAACGSGAGNDSEAGNAPKIGLLLPSATTARWEGQDRPLLEKKIKELCDNCTVEHGNAKGDVAVQQEQMDSMITREVDAIVLVAVDARSLGAAVKKAADADVPVIAYDRLAEGPISGYVSFDGEEVGRLQGRALLTAMGDRANGGQIVMMNGDPSDPNAVSFKKGALSVLEGRVRIGKTYDTPQWRPETANMNMSSAISAVGADNIDGVYAANDGLAAGSISALRANKVDPLPPVTGQDAELGAVRNVVAGSQYMTVYKPFAPEASAGAAMAVAAARGESLDQAATDTVRTTSGRAVPAVMLTPVSVTADNIKETLVKNGVYTIEQVCIPQLRAACDKAGLT